MAEPNFFRLNKNLSIVRKIVNTIVNIHPELKQEPEEETIQQIRGELEKNSIAAEPAAVRSCLILMWEVKEYPSYFSRRVMNENISLVFESALKRYNRKKMGSKNPPEWPALPPNKISPLLRKTLAALFDKPTSTRLASNIKNTLKSIVAGQSTTTGRFVSPESILEWLKEHNKSIEDLKAAMNAQQQGADTRERTYREGESRKLVAHFRLEEFKRNRRRIIPPSKSKLPPIHSPKKL